GRLNAVLRRRLRSTPVRPWIRIRAVVGTDMARHTAQDGKVRERIEHLGRVELAIDADHQPTGLATTKHRPGAAPPRSRPACASGTTTSSPRYNSTPQGGPLFGQIRLTGRSRTLQRPQLFFGGD